MQKFVMKLIKKYNIDIKNKRNIKIKECFSNLAYYQIIIDDDIQIDPMDKKVLKSVNYCGINKVVKRIFSVKKCPKKIIKFSAKIVLISSDRALVLRSLRNWLDHRF